MRAIGTPPEADLRAVANHDFSRLAPPLLIAAATRAQFDEFVWRQALVCSEVRRFREMRHHRRHPEGKILILLPGYHRDFQTAAAVDWWVNDQDRYTVQLDAPRPLITREPPNPRHPWGILILTGLITWIIIAWLVLR